MSFVAGKVVWWLFSPGNLLLLGLVIGVACLWFGRPRLGRGLLTILVGLSVASLVFPVGRWATTALEQRFPASDQGVGTVTGIILLGGAERPVLSAARGIPSVNAAADRHYAFARLARRHPEARLVFSGGSGLVFERRHTDADVAVPILEQLGIPRTRLTVDATARNTAESAEILFRQLRPRQGETWLLVTSARHVPRAVGAFRRAGWPPETLVAAPADYRTLPVVGPVDVQGFSAALGGIEEAAREWIGLVGYRLTGRTDTLFPRPQER